MTVVALLLTSSSSGSGGGGRGLCGRRGSMLKLLEKNKNAQGFGFGFGCADGKEVSVHLLGFSCSSKGFALLYPRQARDKGGILRPVQS